MKKEDFKVGQTVWIYLIGNAARDVRAEEERIEEWEVVSVGKKYLRAKKKGWDYGDVKFDMSDNFCQRSDYLPNYELYLTKEALLKELWRRKVRKEIYMSVQYNSNVLKSLGDEELNTIHEILERHGKENERDTF